MRVSLIILNGNRAQISTESANISTRVRKSRLPYLRIQRQSEVDQGVGVAQSAARTDGSGLSNAHVSPQGIEGRFHNSGRQRNWANS